MLDSVIDFFVVAPERLEALGRATVNTGGFILVVGVVGWAARGMLAAVHHIGGSTAPSDLATLWPDVPTWWVPETLPGAMPAIVLALIGWRLAVFARRLRQYT